MYSENRLLKCGIFFRENFYKLLDEKTFKDEIVSFSVDSENSTIIAEHRPDLLPVLMR